MSATRFQLSVSDFRQDWNSTDPLITNDNWENIANVMGHRGDDLVATTGADPRTITASSTSERVVDYFISASGNPSAGGVFLAKLANPTIALNGSGTADAPSITLYFDSTGRQDIRFQAKIRDIDASADNALQQIAVQWRVADGSWKNVAYVADATTADSDTQVTTVDVTLPAGANDSASLEIRIITTNAAGNDEAVGIDDIFVSSVAFLGGDTTAPVLIESNPTDPDNGATAVPLTSNIVLRFSEIVVAGTGNFTLSNGSDIRVIAVNDSRVTIEGATVTISSSGDLLAGTSYTLTAPSGILEDTAGNDFDGIAAGLLNFTTAQPLLFLSIGDIQGASHTSPFVHQTVQTEGVVTAVDTNGFYIQSALGASDGSSRTSDGIFVLTSTEPAVTLGSLLRVTAMVQEFRPGGDTRNLTTTQLTDASWLNLGNAAVENVIIGTGGRLPPNQIIDNDGFGIYDIEQDGIDFWESLEGMLVTIDAAIAISNTNSFGETYVVASGGAGTIGQASGGGLTLAADDFNPERIQLDNDNGLFGGFKNQFSIGDRLSNVTGVISYSFQAFEVLVTQAVTTTLDVTATKEITTLVKAADKLSVASYNLENLSANDAPAKLSSLASDIVNSLKSPDIIGVQEIQDADGTGAGSDISGTATAATLIAAIKAAGGPTYTYVEIAPSAPGTTGGEPGGNIRNGYLYDPMRVSLIPASLKLIDGPAFNGSRKPLVAGFEFNGEIITFINVHFTSRSGSNSLWGSLQPPSNAGDAARTAQGEAVRAWVEASSSSSPSNIVVLGDFNGFTWEGGISALTRNGLMQDLSDLLPAAERYSYQFEGNNQQLDHIIVTGPLFRRAQFDAVQINSQLPAARQVSTDHDAALSLFTIALPADTAAPAVTTFAPADGSADVTASTNIVVTFNETIARGTGTIEIRSGSATGSLVESFDATSSARLIVSGSTLTIDPTDNLIAGMQYFVVLSSGTVSDAVGNAYTGTSSYDFTISVAPNFAAASQTVSTNEDTAKAITLAATDADNDPLTYTAADAGNGTVAVSGAVVTYTPRLNFNGSDSFVVTASDGKGGSANQTVNVNVAAVNDAPTFSATSQSVSATAGTAKTIALAATDVDGDALTYTVATPGKGTATISGSTLTYTPTSSASGTDSFAVTARDLSGATATQTINATIAASSSFRLTVSDGWKGSVGGNGLVFGTSGYQDITVLSGSVTFDASFNKGGDVIRFDNPASNYTVVRSGSSAQISAGSSLTAVIPMGTIGIATSFADGIRKMAFSGGSFVVGAQAFSSPAATITATPDGTAAPTGADSAASARLSLSGGALTASQTAHVTISGKATIFGTSSNDVVALDAGKSVNLTFDASFNKGGDIIILDKDAGSYSAVRSGSSILLTATNETLNIPVGTAGLTLRFTDGDRTMLFTGGAFKIGDQSIGTAATALTPSVTYTSIDLGTASASETVSGAGAKVIFTDDATKNSFVKITNFGSDDLIRVTGATDYNFTTGDLDSDGTADDLSISLSNPDTGIINEIFVLNSVSTEAFIFDRASAVSAVGFNFITFG